MPDLTITSLTAALFALLLIPLTMQVGLYRLKSQIFFGDGGDLTLARRRAAQSNFVQYAPFALIVLLLCEMGGAPDWLLIAAAASLVLGRSAHAWCMLAGDGVGNLRAAGMLLTFVSFLLSGAWLMISFVSRAWPGV